MSIEVPTSTTVLVIGGGPGGSYAASLLAREGLDVVVLEAEKFPRYHVGESQLASMKHFLRLIDLEKEFMEYGFQRKNGAGFKLNQHKREGYTHFTAKDPNNFSWNVVRSESDDLMLRHASKCGAQVFEETKVLSLQFDGLDSSAPSTTSRPISATWKSKSGATGSISFDYVIDASGRNGIISTKYLKNRKFNQDLLNVASWGYYSDAKKYMEGTERENSPFFEALIDETGWAWFIPLHDGTTSVGVVQNQEAFKAKKAAAKASGYESTSLMQYLSDLKLAPNLERLLHGAELVKKEDSPLLSSASDFSYTAESYAGPGWRAVGDAGCFIDPFFSSGVHLAIAGAVSATATICGVLRRDWSEEEAIKWHTKRVETSYTRFLLVVLSAYHQMRSQKAPVLSNVDEDNFDRAFEHFRPIIQGMSDSGVAGTVKEEELSKSIEFLAQHTFASGIQGEHRRLDNGQIAHDSDTDSSDDQIEARRVKEAKSIIQKKAVRELLQIDDQQIDGYISHIIDGYRMRLERGMMGMEKVN